MEQPKKRKYLIATHGTFSKGVKSSLNMIIGDTESLYIIEAYVNNEVNIEDQIKLVLDEVGDEDELIIFSDIMGGSVTNQLLQQALKPNTHIISGFNLPLLIEIILANTETPITEVIDDAIINAKEQMVYINKLINSNNEDAKDD
jgi:fructoselysine and glucoselysine-specific PTS system IIA component